MRTRYGIAHCGLERYVEGDVASCCSGDVVATHDLNLRPAFSVDSEIKASIMILVKGGRLILGAIVLVSRLLRRTSACRRREGPLYHVRPTRDGMSCGDAVSSKRRVTDSITTRSQKLPDEAARLSVHARQANGLDFPLYRILAYIFSCNLNCRYHVLGLLAHHQTRGRSLKCSKCASKKAKVLEVKAVIPSDI